MDIPFFKPHISEAEINEVVETLRSGWLTTGPRARRFEQEFASYMQRKHAIAVNSCTAALHLALEALGIGPHHAVLVPTMTFAATAEVVRYLQASPILVDCRASDFNLDLDDASRRLRTAQAQGLKVVAIMPVHYGGQIGEVDALLHLARTHQLHVVEDAAHCCPGRYRSHPQDAWKSVGAFSDVSCFSFYANKTITTGEGGMACTDSDVLAERMRVMSLHGISKDPWKRFTADGSWYYEIVAPGFKYNLTDVAAAIGLHQLRKADWLHAERCRVAETYHRLLAEVPEVIRPGALADRVHSWHLYVIRLRLELLGIDRAKFIEELRGQGIVTSVHWMPLHLHPYYRETYGLRPEDYPTATALFRETISLPIYPGMTEEQIAYVCNAIRHTISRHPCRH